MANMFAKENVVTVKNRIPKNAKRIPLRPLALGEATGHNHRLHSEGSVAVEDACELYEFQQEGGTAVALRVTEEGISLIHAEGTSTQTADHHRHSLIPMDYRFVQQREESDWGPRNVID